MINVLFTLVSIALVDRLGRRPLLLTGLAAMILGLSALGLAFQLSNLGQALGWMAIVSLMVYVAGFAIGLGLVFWLLIAEIYPLSVRAQAMSIATIANWGANLDRYFDVSQFNWAGLDIPSHSGSTASLALVPRFLFTTLFLKPRGVV